MLSFAILSGLTCTPGLLTILLPSFLSERNQLGIPGNQSRSQQRPRCSSSSFNGVLVVFTASQCPWLRSLPRSSSLEFDITPCPESPVVDLLCGVMKTHSAGKPAGKPSLETFVFPAFVLWSGRGSVPWVMDNGGLRHHQFRAALKQMVLLMAGRLLNGTHGICCAGPAAFLEQLPEINKLWKTNIHRTTPSGSPNHYQPRNPHSAIVFVSTDTHKAAHSAIFSNVSRVYLDMGVVPMERRAEIGLETLPVVSLSPWERWHRPEGG